MQPKGRPQYSAPRLPRFWGVVRRRWPVLVVLPILALGLAAYNYTHAARAYTASGEVTLTSLAPHPADPLYGDYYTVLTSEASSDDLVRIVPGSTFATGVMKRLQAQGQNISAGEIQGALSATRIYRAVTVNATTGDPGRSVTIAKAAVDELAANAPSYFPGRPVQATIINTPSGAGAKPLKASVLAAGTFIAGALAAAVIALLVDLFDTRLHDRATIEEQLGVPVVGRVPRRRASAERAA